MYRRSQLPNRRDYLGRDEAHLPKGQCQYLLLHPEVRGQRCSCPGFSLQRSTPGSSCNCGHQACYHLAFPSLEEGSADRKEIEALKVKVHELEQRLEEERHEARVSLTSRLSELEDVVDKCKAEMEMDMKNAYRGIEGLWQNVGTLQKHVRSHDDRIDAVIDANQATQDDVRTLRNRVIALDDASMLLEDRVDSLTDRDPATNTGAVTRAPIADTGLLVVTRRMSSEDFDVSRAWTVHISLLPTASQPFPFEKDTMAYKRCLSRGLHRIVAIPGTDSQSFTQTVSKEFVEILQGQEWMPLVPKICNAENLRGLPMLRQLPAAMINRNLYNLDFLKKNCATPDVNGNILDLYIAMRNDIFSWPELKASPTFLTGLEGCWDFDPFLDGPLLDVESNSCNDTPEEASNTEEKLSAGHILRAWSPPATKLKRDASAVSRTSSFGSADGDSKRAKVQRQCVGASVESVGRHAEAV